MPGAGLGPAIQSSTARPSSENPVPAPAAPGPARAASAGIESAVSAIETEFSIYLPHPERIAAACDELRREAAAPIAPPPPAWLVRLLPLPAKRSGALVLPLFDWMEEIASTMSDAWPVADAMLATQDAALQHRALMTLARAVEEGRAVVSLGSLETIAELTEGEGSGLATEEGLREIGRIIETMRPSPGSSFDSQAHTELAPFGDAQGRQDREGPGLHLVASGPTPSVQRLAARVLDLGVAPPGEDLVRLMLGDEAAVLLAPYLAFSRATHMDVVAMLPAARSPAILDSIRRTADAVGERVMCDVVAALGWPRLNLGIEARSFVGVSLSDSFPLLLSPAEALLLGECPGARRVFERQLIVAAGGGVASVVPAGGAPGSGPAAAPDSSDTLSRFRSYNVLHADLLSEILDVAPLTRARLEGILEKTASLASDFAALFGGSTDRATRAEAEALVRIHADLHARIVEALANTTADPLPMEVCRLVQPFEDPAGPSEIRTLHGLKRYLHQRGLKLAFGLIGSGPKTTKTVDLVVVTPERGIEVGRHIEFVDLEGAQDEGTAPAIPHPVRLVVDAFARQMLHAQAIPSHVRVFCYGTEVHYFARFRNHPAFIRIDYSPPLRGGMIDLQYLGVSNYDLDVHPRLSLDAIRRFFERLDFIVSIDSTSIHARYDKERAVTLDELHGRAALLFHLVPYLMDVDWAIGSLQMSDEARDLVATAWASFFTRWGVLPYGQFMTQDRGGILARFEMGPEGLREVRWNGVGAYRDRFSVNVAEAAAVALQEGVASLGIEPASPVHAEDLEGQLSLDHKVLAPLRSALGRGEVVSTPSGLERCHASCFERMHEVDRLAAILESDPARVAQAAHLAQVVPLIERHVRFRTSGSINGYAVQHARVSLGSSVLAFYVLRDGMGMARLACAADDEFLWRRRTGETEAWTDSGDLEEEDVLGLLRRGNVLGAAPDPIAIDAASLTDELRRTFGVPRSSSSPRPFEGERVASGVSASPGRAAGVARLGAARRSPRDLQGAVLVAAGLDPKDAPCLFNAAAVVATGGGILSHLGLLAVESGKPAVILDARWDVSVKGESVLTFKTQAYEILEHERGPYRLVERHHLREIEHEIHDGDLVTVDADQATLTLLGRDATTLALHEALRQHATASHRLERAGEDAVLVERGHHLRTRHQVEKVIARVSDPALVRFAVEEILLGPAWAGTTRALRDGVSLLRLLAGRAASADAALASVRHVTMRLAGRVREARAQATQHIPAAATVHDVLALRLAVLRLHETLRRITAALEDGGLDAGVVGAGDQDDLNLLAVQRLVELREDLAQSLGDGTRAGGRRARVDQLRRVDEVLGMNAGLKSCATTDSHTTAEVGATHAGLKSCATTDSHTTAEAGATHAGLKSCATTDSHTTGEAGATHAGLKSGATYVLTSRDGGLELEAIVGAKAANLAEVARILGDESVPSWSAVTDRAFQEALDTPASGPDGAPTLRAAIDAILRDTSGTHAAHASAIRDLWERLRLPAAIVSDVLAAYRAFGPDCYVAVRSSASDEDTERASRAGQFDTFLFVRGEASVLDHLKLAWSGLWTERALASASTPVEGFAPHCGVVVQRMVQSRVSGVMQTVNAAESRPLEIVINVGLGLGEGIVSGAVAADLVIVSKDGPRDLALRFRYLTADKRQRVIFDERFGQGTVRADTLAHQRLRPALEYPELRELVDVALRIERAYGHPVDIEFGFEDAHLRVLQVRPVPASLAVWHETMERFPLNRDGSMTCAERPGCAARTGHEAGRPERRGKEGLP